MRKVIYWWLYDLVAWIRGQDCAPWCRCDLCKRWPRRPLTQKEIAIIGEGFSVGRHPWN